MSQLLLDHPTNEKSMKNLYLTAVSTSVNHPGNYICQSYVNELQTMFSEKCEVANRHSTWSNTLDEDSKFTGMYQRRISVQSVFKLQFCLAILREILQYGQNMAFSSLYAGKPIV